MLATTYPTHNIYLPSNNGAIKKIIKIAYLSCAASLIIGTLMLFGGVITILGYSSLDVSIVNVPISLGIIIGSLSQLVLPHIEAKSSAPFLVGKMLSVMGSLILVLIGVLLLGNTLLPKLAIPFFPSSVGIVQGLTFILTGLSLFFGHLKITHRFHFVQAFALIVIFFNSYTLLVSLYSIFVPVYSLTNSTINSFVISLVMIIFSLQFLLAKPARGFCGLFTMDSLSSKLALRSLFYIILAPPILGGIVILTQRLKLFDSTAAIPLMAIVLIFLFIVIAWLNGKSLYHLEQESYLMREALRVNSISLELSAEDLTKQLADTEKSKKDAEDKFSNSLSLSDLVGDQD